MAQVNLPPTQISDNACMKLFYPKQLQNNQTIQNLWLKFWKDLWISLFFKNIVFCRPLPLLKINSFTYFLKYLPPKTYLNTYDVINWYLLKYFFCVFFKKNCRRLNFIILLQHHNYGLQFHAGMKLKK